MEQIGNNLQRQYERWQPRARYKQLLDPTTDDVRKLCVALRKNAKVCAKRNLTLCLGYWLDKISTILHVHVRDFHVLFVTRLLNGLFENYV